MKAGMLLTAVMALLLSGCGDDIASPNTARFGRYLLNSIDGRPVPTIYLESANSRLEFLSGALRINEDGTFTDSTEIRVTPMFRGEPTPGGEVVHRYDVAWGLHHISGDTVYLNSLRGEHYFMIVQASGSLTQELVGQRLHYRRP